MVLWESSPHLREGEGILSTSMCYGLHGGEREIDHYCSAWLAPQKGIFPQLNKNKTPFSVEEKKKNQNKISMLSESEVSKKNAQWYQGLDTVLPPKFSNNSKIKSTSWRSDQLHKGTGNKMYTKKNNKWSKINYNRNPHNAKVGEKFSNWNIIVT